MWAINVNLLCVDMDNGHWTMGERAFSRTFNCLLDEWKWSNAKGGQCCLNNTQQYWMEKNEECQRGMDGCVATQTQGKIFHQTHTHSLTHHMHIWILCVHSLNRTIIATWIPFNNFSRWTDYHPCLFSIIIIIVIVYIEPEQLPLYSSTMFVRRT